MRRLRLPLAALLVTALLLMGLGSELLQRSLPAMQQVFAWVAPDLRLLSLQAQGAGALPRLTVIVSLARPTQVGSHWMQPHPLGTATASVHLGLLLQGPAVLMALVLGWPGTWRTSVRRLLLGLPLCGLLWLSDAPLVLGGLIWELMLDAHAPGSATWLTRSGDFLQGGGRLALAAACAWLAIASSRDR